MWDPLHFFWAYDVLGVQPADILHSERVMTACGRCHGRVAPALNTTEQMVAHHIQSGMSALTSL